MHFLSEANIVPVVDIMPLNKEQIKNIQGKSFYFTEMEPVRKTVSERKYLSVTTSMTYIVLNET